MRLATFNILHGRSPVDGQVDLDRFAAAVRDLDADVLALQEVDRDQPRSHGADLTTVAAEPWRRPSTGSSRRCTGPRACGRRRPATTAARPRVRDRAAVPPTRCCPWRVLDAARPAGQGPVRWPGSRWPIFVRDEPRAALAAVVQGPQAT